MITREEYGRRCAAECEFYVSQTKNGLWIAHVSIDDYYYETDPYKNKQDALDEQRGCLLVIREAIDKYLTELKGE